MKTEVVIDDAEVAVKEADDVGSVALLAKTDFLMPESFANKHAPVTPFDLPIVAHATFFVMRIVPWFALGTGPGPWRWHPVLDR